jgi:hypothetical protein
MDCRAFQALAGYRKKGGNVYFGQFLTYDTLVVRDRDKSGVPSNCDGLEEVLSSGRYWLSVDSEVEVGVI